MAQPKKQALGRGLSALLKDPQNDIRSVEDKNAEKIVANMVDIDLSAIEANPGQPRQNFNTETLEELASSIKELGVVQPITVRKTGFNKYQIISGERRYRASKMADLKTIPAYVRIADDNEVLEMALVENIQREDLNPIDTSLTFQRLIEESNLTQEELSKRVGKKRSTITNYLRLLKLSPVIQSSMRDGILSMGHGRALINIEDAEAQTDIYKKIIARDMSVRDTETLVRQYQEGKTPNAKKPRSKADPDLPPYISKGIGEFRTFFEKNIDVTLTGKEKGKLLIPFSSKEEFEQMVNLLKNGL